MRLDANWDHRTLTEDSPIQFDPAANTFLFRPDGSTAQLPYVTYPYISMHALLALWGRVYPRSIEDRNRLTAQMEADLTEKVGQHIRVQLPRRGQILAKLCPLTITR